MTREGSAWERFDQSRPQEGGGGIPGDGLTRLTRRRLHSGKLAVDIDGRTGHRAVSDRTAQVHVSGKSRMGAGWYISGAGARPVVSSGDTLHTTSSCCSSPSGPTASFERAASLRTSNRDCETLMRKQQQSSACRSLGYGRRQHPNLSSFVGCLLSDRPNRRAIIDSWSRVPLEWKPQKGHL